MAPEQTPRDIRGNIAGEQAGDRLYWSDDCYYLVRKNHGAQGGLLVAVCHPHHDRFEGAYLAGPDWSVVSEAEWEESGAEEIIR